MTSPAPAAGHAAPEGPSVVTEVVTNLVTRPEPDGHPDAVRGPASGAILVPQVPDRIPASSGLSDTAGLVVPRSRPAPASLSEFILERAGWLLGASLERRRDAAVHPKTTARRPTLAILVFVRILRLVAGVVPDLAGWRAERVLVNFRKPAPVTLVGSGIQPWRPAR